MRKRANRTVRPATTPCLIAVGLNDKHERGLLAAVQAFRMGVASADNFLDLCDARDITAIAYNMQRKPVDGLCPALEVAGTALLNIRDRWKEKGVYGVSGEELAALSLLVDTYQNYWVAQSGDLYRRARAELYRTRRAEAEKTAA